MKQCYEKRNTILFVLLQSVLYVVFIVLDISGNFSNLSNRIKFSIIILCFCYALFYYKDDSKGIVFCIRTAILFTMVSDLFILILDYYFYGVLTFIVVQQLYGIRNSIAWRGQQSESRFSIPLSFLIRISLQLAITGGLSLFLWMLGVKMEGLLIASVFYFISIVTNVVHAINIAIHNRKSKANQLFALGISLFLLCDINVGFFNLSEFISIPEQQYQVLYSISSILMWTFYAPSQVIIALSGYSSDKIDKKEENFYVKI